MGEATYYAKMYFENQAKAEEKLEDIRSFFYEGGKAHDYWQDNRSMKEKEHFWGQLEFKFPMVAEYLKSIVDEPHRMRNQGDKVWGTDHDNGLAGLLDFGEDNDIKHMGSNGEYIYYCAMVWHFANWDPIMDFIQAKFGAVNCKWISDEHMEPFDLI